MFFNLYGPGVVNPKVGTVDAMALQNVCMTVLLMASYSFYYTNSYKYFAIDDSDMGWVAQSV